MVEQLERAGWRVWWDRKLRAGDLIHQKIEQALNLAGCVIVVWSKNSVVSRWVVGEAEEGCAREILIPVSLDGVIPPIPFRTLHTVDLSGWRDGPSPEVVEVLRAVEALLRPPPLPPKSTETVKLQEQRIKHPRVSADEVLQESQHRPGPAFVRAVRRRRPSLVCLLDDSAGLSRQRALQGRKTELSRLHQAWDSGKPGARDGRKTNLLIISGAPGEGKTALVRQWRNELLARADDRDLPDLVFEHSFSSQGASSAREVSSFWFLRRACENLGIDVPSTPPEGVRVEQYMREQLARRMKEQRALLFLDGVEPLQSMPPHAVLHDAELRHLLNDLAASNPGLVVVTTRYPFYNLDTAGPKGPCDHYQLPPLDHRAAMGILDEYNVQGTEDEKREMVELFRLNALSLNLLGNFLRDSPVRRWWELSRQLGDAKDFQNHTNILRAFDAHFGLGSQEVSLLRMLGLFDRAVSSQLLDELCKDPIGHLNEPFRRAGTSWRERAREALKRHGLMTEVLDWRGKEPAELDCHPLVRQYYSEQLRALDRGRVWRSAHERLYEHFLGHARKQDGVAMDERTLEPLFRAIHHGCLAGREKEAFDLYLTRIEGGEDRLHATEGLGLTAMTLEAISNFFDTLWLKPSEDLDSPARGWLLSQAGYRLQCLGRLDDARDPKQAALRVFEAEKRWDKAATEAGRLCELHVYAGEPTQALEQARNALLYAGRVPHSPDQWYQRAKLAWVHHYLGDREQAAREFKAAEETFRSMNSGAKFMCHSAGFLYCDFLLDEPAHAEEVILRAEWMLEMSARQEGRTFRRRQVDEGQAKIALGHALLHRAQEKDEATLQEALVRAEDAARILWKAHIIDELPRALLLRARVCMQLGRFPDAERDLSEVEDIARRGGFVFYQVDAHLLRALLLERRRAEVSRVEDELAQAASMAHKQGYGRRVRLIMDARARLARHPRPLAVIEKGDASS